MDDLILKAMEIQGWMAQSKLVSPLDSDWSNLSDFLVLCQNKLGLRRSKYQLILLFFNVKFK